MIKNIFIAFGLALLMTTCVGDVNNPIQQERKRGPHKKISVQYPETFQDDAVIDNYHGKLIADPYRWLEDDNSDETQDWVTRQNQVTFSYLEQIPYRRAIRNRLEKLWNFERFSTPFKEGGKYYFFKNDGLQNQSVLYVQNDLNSLPREVLDPNKFSEDGTTSLGGLNFSKDGKRLAYQVSEGGSDWRTAYVKDLSIGKVLEDKLNWLKFTGLAWFKDGFFYSRYPEPEGDDVLSGVNEFHQVYYHKVGTDQSKDEMVFADRGNPGRGFSASVTEDENFLALGIWETTSGNALYFKDLTDDRPEFIPIEPEIEDDYQLIGNAGDRLFILTNNKAPNQKLIEVSAMQPEREYWEDLIPESRDVLDSVYLIAGKIVAQYIHNAHSIAKIFDFNGKWVSDVELPGIGTIGGFSGKMEDETAFYSFTSFTQPSTIYQLDMKTYNSKVFKAPRVDFKSGDYETRQVWYKSLDKKKVPMFITHKKGLKMDGRRPTLLYGYGGFDISVKPGFSLTRALILENDGVYAVANIRGGGEFGKDWHLAGTKERKQNVFNDFMAAAEYLVKEGYTSSEKLAIQGGSNGGLLVGACMTQRPDLFKVALPAVGVLDMLRYHEFTIGKAWASDYGLSSDPKAFNYLISYSPLHNIEQAEYPATLVTTADHDDRVVPAHSFKFISELQANHQGDNPVLIRVETSAGHGTGKPVSKQIDESTDWLSFMFYNFEEDVKYDHDVLD